MKFENRALCEWLEEAVRRILESGTECVGLCTVLPSGDTLTAYYHADARDKALFAHEFYSDCILDSIKANRAYLEEDDDE